MVSGHKIVTMLDIAVDELHYQLYACMSKGISYIDAIFVHVLIYL